MQSNSDKCQKKLLVKSETKKGGDVEQKQKQKKVHCIEKKTKKK